MDQTSRISAIRERAERVDWQDGDTGSIHHTAFFEMTENELVKALTHGQAAAPGSRDWGKPGVISSYCHEEYLEAIEYAEHVFECTEPGVVEDCHLCYVEAEAAVVWYVPKYEWYFIRWLTPSEFQNASLLANLAK